MNLFFVLLAVAAVAAVGYYAYTWWRKPAGGADQFADSGAFLVRSSSLYGGYPTPLIYKKRSENNYIMALFDPAHKEAVAQLTEREMRVVLDSYAERYEVLSGAHTPTSLAALFAPAIREHQANALLSLGMTEPADLVAREQEIAALAKQPEAVIADQIAFMRDQLA